MSQTEHAVIKRVKPGQGNKLKLVPHRAQFTLKFSDAGAVEFLFPVERRRAVIGEKLIGIATTEAFGKLFCFGQVRLGRFTPNHVGEKRVTETPRNRLV